MHMRVVGKWLSRLLLVALVIWVGSSAVADPSLFVANTALGISNGAVYSLIAIGFALIYNISQLIDFAHGDVFMFSAVIGTVVLVDIGGAESSTLRNWGWFAVAYVVAIILGTVVSVATDRIVFRRLRSAPTLAPLVASIGVALVLQNIGLKYNGSGPKKIHSVIPEFLYYSTPGPALVRMAIILALTLPIILTAVFYIERSRNGRAIKAVADDIKVAPLMGINVDRVTVWAFAIAGACAGAAGLMYAQEARVVSFQIGMKIGLIGYAAAIIGGVGRIQGAALGGFFIGLVQSLIGWMPNGLGGQWDQTIIFSTLILMLVYKPEGLWGLKHPAHD